MDYLITAYLHAYDEGIKIYIPEKRVGLRLDFVNVIAGIIFCSAGIYEFKQYYDSGLKIALGLCFLFILGAAIMFMGFGNPENTKEFGQQLDKMIIEFMYRLFGPGTYYRDPNVKIETNYIQSDMIRENQAIDFTRLLPVMVSNVGDDFYMYRVVLQSFRFDGCDHGLERLMGIDVRFEVVLQNQIHGRHLRVHDDDRQSDTEYRNSSYYDCCHDGDRVHRRSHIHKGHEHQAVGLQ